MVTLGVKASAYEFVGVGGDTIQFITDVASLILG